MRKVVFGVANSLDNFIARADHSVDWLIWNDEVASFVAGFWKSVGAVLMGRKTYEAGVRLGTTSYPNVENYVFSRTMRVAPDPAVQIVGTDAAEFVRQLKQTDGGDICVRGGGELAQSLFAADLIDEIGVNIHPVLLGSGVPLFLDMPRADRPATERADEVRFRCVPLQYDVLHPSASIE